MTINFVSVSAVSNRVSIDIESGVRSGDKLDMGLVRDYLLNCGFDGVSKNRKE